MAHGAVSRFGVTFTSGATFSSEINLGRAWSRMYVCPAGAAAEVRFLGSDAAGGTFRQVYMPQVGSTSTVQSNIWKIASAVSGGMQEGPGGIQFLKLEATAAVANGATLTIICSDN